MLVTLRRRRAAHRCVGLLALALAGAPASPAWQLMDGMVGFKAYEITFGRRVIGHVVVVGSDNADPPAGYAAGQEYWTWTRGAAWRGSFTLQPVDAVPEHDAHEWTTFPHERFDLSHTVPMPAIAPQAGDRFYRVQVHDGSRWVARGWMWLMTGPPMAQEWFGRNLTSDLVGDEGAIRFSSAEPPRPGSRAVYRLVH